MGIPFWIWILMGLTAISWIVPDAIPGEEFLLPALIVISFLVRRKRQQNYYRQYQKQYQQYRQGQTGAGAGSQYQSGAGSFYSGFRGWGAGHQGAGSQYAGQKTAQTTETAKDPYQVLGVHKGASMDEIKKAYRNKIKKYHPDIVENLKLGPEYREMFEEKTREIKKAYQELAGSVK